MLVVALALLVFHRPIAGLLRRESFVAETWRAQREDESNLDWPARLLMVDALLGGGELDGLTRAEVVELLGPPEPRRTRAGDARSMSYVLGPARKFIPLEMEYLIISFSAAGIVSKTWVREF